MQAVASVNENQNDDRLGSRLLEIATVELGVWLVSQQSGRLAETTFLRQERCELDKTHAEIREIEEKIVELEEEKRPERFEATKTLL